MSDQDSIPSKKSGDLDAALYHASRYRALAKVGHSLRGYETSAVAMLEEIERLQEDVSRYESGRVVMSAEIDRLRMAERLNVETVARLQQERDRLAGQLDAAEQHVKILREERYSQPPKAVPREWIISYSNYLATDLNRAYAHGAQSLDADVADAKHRAMEVDAWLRATSTKAESPRLEDIVDSENWCPQCAHPRGACVCAHETGECPNCFDDKTVTMSDGSKRPCELCAEVAACPDCGLRPAIDGMWHKPGCASL